MLADVICEVNPINELNKGVRVEQATLQIRNHQPSGNRQVYKQDQSRHRVDSGSRQVDPRSRRGRALPDNGPLPGRGADTSLPEMGSGWQTGGRWHRLLTGSRTRTPGIELTERTFPP